MDNLVSDNDQYQNMISSNLFSDSVQSQNLTKSSLRSDADRGGRNDMRGMASTSLDGLSSTGSSSHLAFHSFSGDEVNSYSIFSAPSELDDNLGRPEILIAVDGGQSGGKADYKCRAADSTPDDKGLIGDDLIPIDSMGHSAFFHTITSLEDAQEYNDGVDNGDGWGSGSVDYGSPYNSMTNPIFEWIDRQNVEYDIRSMGEILSNRSDLAIQISRKDVDSWNSLAGDIINENIPQSSNGNDLLHIDYSEVKQNIKQGRYSSVNEFINSSTQPCCLKGRAIEDLQDFLYGYEDADTLIDLLSRGQKSIMKSGFKANGGVKVRQSSSYEKAERNHYVIMPLQNYTKKAESQCYRGKI
jgi:hypothetical protein